VPFRNKGQSIPRRSGSSPCPIIWRRTAPIMPPTATASTCISITCRLCIPIWNHQQS